MDDAVLPEECLQIFRLSLQPSSGLVDTLANTGGVPQSEHIRKIVAAILWHRKFILTYYAWILVTMAVSSGFRFYKRVVRRRKNRNRNGQGLIDHASVAASPSPSCSSTFTKTSTPSQRDDNLYNGERTALLAQPDTAPRTRPSRLNRLKSLLMFQPRPIAAVTSPSNTLPTNAVSLVVLFFLAVNLFYLFYCVPLSLSWIFILADRAGLLFVANLPILYFLAAKNSQPTKYLTGWSYEGLNIFHRRLGEWMTCFAVIHMGGMLAVWYTILRPRGSSLPGFLSTKLVFLGLCAVLSYYLVYLTSTGWFRHLCYETFLVAHIVFQFAALIFLFLHYPTARPYVCVAFAIWAVDRLLWRVTLSSSRFIATLEVAPDGHTVLVHCEVPLRYQKPPGLGIRTNIHHGWHPGQHVFLTVPSMGFKYRFQAHPFTIASPAPPKTTVAMESWPLQLTVRAIDGFSLSLLRYARHHQHCEIVLDGPYGSTSALAAALSADRVCFVAGGSGIAVTYPLSWAIRVRNERNADAGLFLSTRTTYTNGLKTMPSVVADSTPWVPGSKYAHFWVRQEKKHGKWICMVPRATVVESGDDEEAEEPLTDHPDANVLDAAAQERRHDAGANLVTRTFDTRTAGLERGRPDMQSEIYSWVTSVSSSAGAVGKSCYSSAPSSSSSSTAVGEGTPDASSSSSSPSSPDLPALPGPDPNSRDPKDFSFPLKDRDRNSSSRNRDRHRDKICIIVSGPDGLVRDVRNEAAELVRQGGWDIDVWAEKFGW
ncbi:uncharacterized protein Z519_01025 [Cladophialophora bantiana CBS 173.52]|uniref:ferric-chelate reductase (NADPH) n=1 Tax=Cladophialophora bantiana (strain ATCC 10958 / CBS 173.52 / CDC B-1940 / NIH 8579) TaxID=1442370 RepID=A0A0D2F5G0_CLAB1|nr:uncharacterized protein Z519_01025 [Cladophialophora bantiana CBS 173.52]KIW97441.1 hypothetical protein Z519_01025 [Cladophialophora bantiana CBS 173.52]